MKNLIACLSVILFSTATSAVCLAGPMKLVVLKKGDIKDSSVALVSKEITYPLGNGSKWQNHAKGKLCVGHERAGYCTAYAKATFKLQVNELTLDEPFQSEDAYEMRAPYQAGVSKNLAASLLTHADAASLLNHEAIQKRNTELLDFLYDVNAGTVFEGQYWNEGRQVKQLRVYIDSETGKVVKWEAVWAAHTRH